MSFLTEAEANSLQIVQMILHVVAPKSDFIPQPAIAPQANAPFFIARILEMANDAVHEFKTDSLTKNTLEEMALNKISFEIGSQQLSKRFSEDHVGSSRTGVFFIFQLGTDDPNVIIYSMMKYDYQEVIELIDEGTTHALRQIIQAFIKHKKAIQKSSLIRIHHGKAQTLVSATDRMETAPDLTDYFGKFLGVKRERSTQELNKQLKSVIIGSLTEVKDNLPNRDVPLAVRQAKEILRQRISIDDTAISEAVIVAAGSPGDETMRVNLKKIVAKHISRYRLTGVTFPPDGAILKQQQRRVIKTREGVILQFPGELENQKVMKVPQFDGGHIITIRTDSTLVEDGILVDRISIRS